MTAAREHSNYQATIGSITHSGSGGTRPIDRAYSAGYGDGQIIFVSEIIYGGSNASVNDAVSWWKGSAIHNQQILATTYVAIGAGIATDGTWIYYTAVMGYVAGGEAPPIAPPTRRAGGIGYLGSRRHAVVRVALWRGVVKSGRLDECASDRSLAP